MAVDGDGVRADSGLVLLGHAIKKELAGRPQRWLAEAVGVDPSVMTRIIRGQMSEVSIDRVRQVEDALELPRGALLRAAGYVADAVTPEEAIAADLSVPRMVRDAMIAAIEASRRGGHDGDGL